jgi:hypothetical protein
MPYTTYRALPLEALYDLLTISIVDLLAALESKKEQAAIQPLTKQIEAIIELIGEKKNIQYKN